MAKGKLITSNLNHVSNKQHKVPCSDCPFRRDSLPGWLGGELPEPFIYSQAHGDGPYGCHVIVNQQCAGMAVYRANIEHDPAYIAALRLPADPVKVFATPREFLEHHNRLYRRIKEEVKLVDSKNFVDKP